MSESRVFVLAELDRCSIDRQALSWALPRTELRRDRRRNHIDETRRIHRGKVGIKKDGVKEIYPWGPSVFGAWRLKRGKASYTSVCGCRCLCMCCLLWTDNEDSVVNQVLNDVPKSTAIIGRVPCSSMIVTVWTCVKPLWKWVWWRTSFREPQK